MTAAAASTYPLARERNLILATLLVLAAIAWSILLWQAIDGDHSHPLMPEAGVDGAQPGAMVDNDEMSGDGDMPMGLTMDYSALVYVALWATMMVAIMFPTAAPMILTFARVQRNRRQRGQAHVGVWLFVGSYIALWAATGFIAYGIARGGDELAENVAWLMDNAARIGGAVLVVAGVYQLSPLKRICLSKCRTPMGFIVGSWKDGNAGAVRMGLEHGAYCLGCCWMLFVILFPLGMMNVAAMAVITAFIFAEKALPIGRQAATAGAALLIGWGAIALVVPSALPTTI